ncbi:MAG TPA: hypothetical protein VFW25_15295 [Silvibacterium sp.]|nr:hypothetical protein [Silvibacterium sp.]
MSASVSPLVPTPAPQRPLGVVLAAIVLALMSCMGLVSAASVLLISVFVPTSQIPQYPAMQAVQVVSGIFMLLVSGFCAWTVVGLFRMKNWARISILIMGGLVAAFSLLSFVGFSVLTFSSAIPADGALGVDVHAAPGASAAIMKAVFISIAGCYLMGVLLGLWWLFYFSRRRIRMIFAADGLRPGSGPGSQVPAEIEGVWIDSSKSSRGIVEILLICLAALYLIAGASGLITAFLHFPLFVFGFIVRGTTASLFAGLFFVISIGIGVGLLRRMKAAWVTALVFNGFGLVSTLILFIPRNRAVMMDYQSELVRRMFSGLVPVNSNQFMLGPFYLLGEISGVLTSLAIFWLLIRARPLFDRK